MSAPKYYKTPPVALLLSGLLAQNALAAAEAPTEQLMAGEAMIVTAGQALKPQRLYHHGGGHQEIATG